MEILLERVTKEKRHNLCNLFQLYMHDITKDLFFETNKDSLYEYPQMDNYFTDEKYKAFFIKLESNIVGFAMISNEFMYLENEENNYVLSEIFILNGYKRKGIAKKAAINIFEKFKGSWEVKPVPRSESARAFWENTINEYTKGKYNIVYPEPNRTTFIFNNN